MDKNSYELFIIMQETIEANRQYMKASKQEYDEKMINITEDFKEILASTIISTMDQINIIKSYPSQRDSPKPKDPITAFLAISRDITLVCGHYTKIIGMWTLKNEISSSKFYELLIKTELKGDTTLGLNNFYNHIKMCLNALTRLIEDLLPGYQSTKRSSYFKEYFVSDSNHASYSCNLQVYTSLGHSL